MRGLSERGAQSGQFLDFFVAQGARFVFEQDGNALAHRVSQSGAAREQLLGLAVKIQRSFGDRADQQFKQFFVHGRMIVLAHLCAAEPVMHRAIGNPAARPKLAVNVARV